MYQEIYIDVVFAANLLMDYLLLRLVGWFLRCRAGADDALRLLLWAHLVPA